MKNVDKFMWKEGDTTISLCASCRHWRGRAKCKAYPDGIPLAIRTNIQNHRNPQEGDHGIQFEPIEGDND